jgi:hypothetical protein
MEHVLSPSYLGLMKISWNMFFGHLSGHMKISWNMFFVRIYDSKPKDLQDILAHQSFAVHAFCHVLRKKQDISPSTWSTQIFDMIQGLKQRFMSRWTIDIIARISYIKIMGSGWQEALVPECIWSTGVLFSVIVLNRLYVEVLSGPGFFLEQ